MTFRACRRALALALILTRCIVRYWFLRLRGSLSLEQRALWLQSSCRWVLSSLHVESRISGNPPARGLVVSNHLSYLDIILLAAAMPCCFVAKSEIAGWPVFGRAARAGGTIFLVRTSRANAMSVAREIERRLALPVPVLLFPEGTSTDGSRVLRFHSRLIDPAVVALAPVTPVALRYSAPGLDERELCWFGDTRFLPHLWKTLGAPEVQAEVHFGVPSIYSDRRTAARETHAKVVALRIQGEEQIRRGSA